MRFSFCLLVLAGALVGCSDHPVDQLIAVGESTNDQLCSCPAFESEDFCTMPEEVSQAEKACLKRVYNEYEPELAAEFNCVLDAFQEVHGCVNRARCDGVTIQSCFEVLNARTDACPESSAVAAEMFDACSG